MTVTKENLEISRLFAECVNGRYNDMELAAKLYDQLDELDTLRNKGDDDHIPEEAQIYLVQETVLYSAMLAIIQTRQLFNQGRSAVQGRSGEMPF